MIFLDKTAYTSPEYSMPTSGDPFADLWIGVTGTGTAYIDVQDETGAFREFPPYAINGPDAQVVTVPRGRFRVRIDAVTATTVRVEVR